MKRTKESVDYSPGKHGKYCGVCVHYLPRDGKCTLVEGAINRMDWCRLFTLARKGNVTT